MPNSNHAAYLPERLQSILNQTYTHTKPIILDDAWTDDSVEIIKTYFAGCPHKLMINITNSGSTFVQWDRGIQVACERHIETANQA